MSFDETLAELLNTLDEIIVILEWDGENHWFRIIQRVKWEISEARYSTGIQRLLGIYGGMGSFNDLVIGQNYKDGKFSWREGAQEKNEELYHLRAEVHRLAIELRAALK